jgi:CBS domain-containing protein
MTISGKRNVLSGLKVREAMRRQVIQLPKNASLGQCIGTFIKFKINAVLVTDEDEQPTGVVSKTDLMGAYYAELPIETPLEMIMVGPPLFCSEDDFLEASLDIMYGSGIHRLYVRGPDEGGVTGVLAYPDIVGLLYRYCRNCKMSSYQRGGEMDFREIMGQIKVKEVMGASVKSHRESETLLEVMEGLSAYRFGAVLIRNDADNPVGVLSKSDLIVAYKHGVGSDVPASTVMASPVVSCDQEELLSGAIQQMIFTDIHRLFVHRGDPKEISGVLSLSDAARARSGSCHACVSSRIKVEQAT